MPVTFSADEIFELAEQIERNGADFYRKGAKCVSDIKLQNMLKELANMEIEHEKTFAAMRAEFTDNERSPAIFDPNDEVGLYLRAMADGRVFDIKTDLCQQITPQATSRDILNTALGLEKDSIIYYLGLEEYVPSISGKDKVRSIIKQEMGHIALLNDKLKDIG